MSRATLFSGLLVALLLSLLGGALLAASTLILAPLTALRLLVALLGLLYLAWLLSKSDEKRGRLVAPVVYMTASGLMLFSNTSLAGLAIGHAGLIWLARSLFLHERPLAAIGDLVLSVLALSGALWAADQTGSFFYALWTFFLVQAFFVLIPQNVESGVNSRSTARSTCSQFEQACSSAESALHRMRRRG